jgi:phospholipid-binding lipoprotein MlaA
MRAALLSRLLLVAGLGSVAACATRPPASDPEAVAEFQQNNDPYEPANRFSYRVSDTLDTYALKPVAQAYVYVLPRPVRGGIHNVLANLSSPVLLANDVLQTKPRRAGDTFMRFLINSSVGVLGIFDVASGWGYGSHEADFGETLALWGLPSGPYLFLPLLGPSNVRDATGYGVDTALDPFVYVPRGYGLLTLNWGRYVVGVIDARSRVLDDLTAIKKTALDPYATIRSLSRQHRASQIEGARDDRRATPPNWDAAPR